MTSGLPLYFARAGSVLVAMDVCEQESTDDAPPGDVHQHQPSVIPNVPTHSVVCAALHVSGAPSPTIVVAKPGSVDLYRYRVGDQRDGSADGAAEPLPREWKSAASAVFMALPRSMVVCGSHIVLCSGSILAIYRASFEGDSFLLHRIFIDEAPSWVGYVASVGEESQVVTTATAGFSFLAVSMTGKISQMTVLPSEGSKPASLVCTDRTTLSIARSKPFFIALWPIFGGRFLGLYNSDLFLLSPGSSGGGSLRYLHLDSLTRIFGHSFDNYLWKVVPAPGLSGTVHLAAAIGFDKIIVFVHSFLVGYFDFDGRLLADLHAGGAALDRDGCIYKIFQKPSTEVDGCCCCCWSLSPSHEDQILYEGTNIDFPFGLHDLFSEFVGQRCGMQRIYQPPGLVADAITAVAFRKFSAADGILSASTATTTATASSDSLFSIGAASLSDGRRQLTVRLADSCQQRTYVWSPESQSWKHMFT